MKKNIEVQPTDTVYQSVIVIKRITGSDTSEIDIQYVYIMYTYLF